MWRERLREGCRLPKPGTARAVELLLQSLVLPAQSVALPFDSLQLSLQPFDLTTLPFELLRGVLLRARGVIDHALVMPEVRGKYKDECVELSIRNRRARARTR